MFRKRVTGFTVVTIRDGDRSPSTKSNIKEKSCSNQFHYLNISLENNVG